MYKDFAEELRQKSKGLVAPSPFPPIPREALTLSLVAVYYFAICGNERVFQAMQFTYGLCGPLQLAPRYEYCTSTVVWFFFRILF